MPLPTTENLPEGQAIDARSMAQAAAFLLDGQHAALDAVRDAVPAITQGAEVLAGALRAGRSLHFAAAGSSGLMALADACELAGTFGIPAKAVQIHMAGGVPTDAFMPGDTEDDALSGAVAAQAISSGDAVVVLTASGTTPYALEVAAAAQSKGACVVGLANNPNTPLLEKADVAICLATPPEVIAGSTRLGAGTAQKAALNLMSTLMGIKLGHVYQGLMVNVVADNAKLIARATGIVATVAGVPTAQAEQALRQMQGQTKLAILLAAGAEPAQASALLQTHEGQLGPCLQSLKTTYTKTA